MIGAGRPRPDLRDPLDGAPPELSAEEAGDLAHRLFGVDGTAVSLGSERDQNFRIDAADGRRFVLKISNAAEDPEVVDMETAAMLRVAERDPSLPVPSPQRTLDDRLQARVERPNGDAHVVRLLTYLPGEPAAEADLTAEALRDFGAVAARMGAALRGFSHPAEARVLGWDVRHAASLRPHLSDVDETRRERIARVLDRFEEHVLPAFARLRTQVIHNDLTFDNVMVDASGRVSGIVDFGDMVRTALVCDVSSCLASVMQSRPDPSAAAEAVVSGYASVTPLTDEEAEVLPDLIAARVAVSLLISAWRVRRHPGNAEYITAWDDDAWELLDTLGRSDPSDLTRRFRAANDGAEAVLARRRARLLGPALSPPSYDRPLHLVRGEGAWLIDAAGRRFLDAYNNVPVVGHGHRRVVEAIERQMRELTTNVRYLHRTILDLAERLAATMPGGLDTCMFVNSGSEANDLAWRLSTAATGRGGAIVTANAYHGMTAATTDLSPEGWAPGTAPPHVETVPAPDAYRGPYRADDPAWVDRYAAHVPAAGAALAGRGHDVGVCMLDPAFTSDGIHFPPAGYLRAVVDAVRDAGAIIVVDEVQTGYGRTGSDLWGFAASEVTPDIVTLGKPAGNGYPLGVVVTRAGIAEAFARTSEFFSTFGGNPVACAAGLAVLEVIEEEALERRAAEAGRRLIAGLRDLASRHPPIGDVRGAGLLIGVELVDGDGRPSRAHADAVMNGMRDRGVLIGTTGADGNVLKIRPPLVISDAECDLLLSTLDDALDDAAATRPGSPSSGR